MNEGAYSYKIPRPKWGTDVHQRLQVPQAAPDSSPPSSVAGEGSRRAWYAQWKASPQVNYHEYDQDKLVRRSSFTSSVSEYTKEQHEKKLKMCIFLLSLLALAGVVASVVLSVIYSKKAGKAASIPKEVLVEFTLTEQFQNSWYNIESATRKNFTDSLETEIDGILSHVETFQKFKVLSLRPGSVIVQGVCYFDSYEQNAGSKLEPLYTAAEFKTTHLQITSVKALVIETNSSVSGCEKKSGFRITLDGRCEECPFGSYGLGTTFDPVPSLAGLVCHPCPVNKTTVHNASLGSDKCIETAEFAMDVKFDEVFIEAYRDKSSTKYKQRTASIEQKIADTGTSGSVKVTGDVILLRNGSTVATVKVSVQAPDRVSDVVRDIKTKLENMTVPSASNNGDQLETSITYIGFVSTSADVSGSTCPEGFFGSSCLPCSIGFYQPVRNQCVPCPAGYTTQTTPSKTCTEIDECKIVRNPCQNGGNCTDKVNGFTCSCLPGYTGAQCEIDINECASSPCQNGGTCSDMVNAYECLCSQEYGGVRCERERQACDSKPCKNTATCTDGGSKTIYTCQCQPGFTGLTCETDVNECSSDPCKNNGTCQDKVNSFECRCSTGFKGFSCETNINECEPNPCAHGNCTDGVAEYSCQCDAGYEGQNCSSEIRECSSNPCQHGGTCKDKVAGYDCVCPLTYHGVHCETDVDECATDNGGCDMTCNNTVGAYTCVCDRGYRLNSDGKTCTQLTKCEQDSPCRFGGICTAIGYTDFSCECIKCSCSNLTLTKTCDIGTGECAGKADGGYPNAYDCGKFYKCINGQLASFEIGQCPGNLYYDRTADQCRSQAEVPNCRQQRIKTS